MQAWLATVAVLVFVMILLWRDIIYGVAYGVMVGLIIAPFWFVWWVVGIAYG